MIDGAVSATISASANCFPQVNAALTPNRAGDQQQTLQMGSAWRRVEEFLHEHYTNPDIEAARILCSALAAHALKEFLPAWCLAIAPPGSAKTDLLEGFRGLQGIHFVDELTTKTFISGKLDEKNRQRVQPASLLHRIGNDGVLVVADFSTFTSDPIALKTILAQLRRIYDGNYTREFGTDDHPEERSWQGRLTIFAGAVPDVDRHYSLFQSLGERFVRTRWPRAGGVEAALQAMEHTSAIAGELRGAVHSVMRPVLSYPQTPPIITSEMKLQIAHLGELVALSRTYVERDRTSREAIGTPVSEGNTRVAQQLCQLARGSALLDGRSEAVKDDYKLVCRAAFDSLPPSRAAVLKAAIGGESPYKPSLPKATVSRAVDDLELSGILAKYPGGAQSQDLSDLGKRLVEGAGLTGAR
jgi:hypothetical protein